MAPPKRVLCQVCDSVESKYTCAKCSVLYCSVPCYKQHKEICPGSQQPGASSSRPPTLKHGDIESSSVRQARNVTTEPSPPQADVLAAEEKPAFKSLESLNWPYVPEESAYPDPLKRDDPKPLQLPQYEAIATSPTVRRILGSNDRLRETLRAIDTLRGEDRERAIQNALGIAGSSAHTLTSSPDGSGEDRMALRELAEAVEAAVRGNKQGMLGLDWGD